MLEISRCTRCNRPFTNLRLGVQLILTADRLKENGIWEEIANLDQSSQEYLCEDCFNLFSDTLTQNLNISYKEEEPKSSF